MSDQFVLRDFDSLSVLVHRVLVSFPSCRDDDLLLCFHVWRLQGLSGRIKFSELSSFGLSKPESISRCRRVIQNDDMILQGERHKNKIKRSEEMRNYFGGIKSE